MSNAARLHSLATRLARDERGAAPIRMALIFSAAAIAGAVLLTPLLRDATQKIASSEAFGIDRTLTGSVRKADRYTIRQSVLSPEPVIICGDGRTGCLQGR